MLIIYSQTKLSVKLIFFIYNKMRTFKCEIYNYNNGNKMSLFCTTIRYFPKYINQNYSTSMNYIHIGRLYKPCIMRVNRLYYNLIILGVKNKCTARVYHKKIQL